VCALRYSVQNPLDQQELTDFIVVLSQLEQYCCTKIYGSQVLYFDCHFVA
jgi:hypothetical protein